MGLSPGSEKGKHIDGADKEGICPFLQFPVTNTEGEWEHQGFDG